MEPSVTRLNGRGTTWAWVVKTRLKRLCIVTTTIHFERNFHFHKFLAVVLKTRWSTNWFKHFMASFEITIDFSISVFRYVPFHFHLGGVFFSRVGEFFVIIAFFRRRKMYLASKFIHSFRGPFTWFNSLFQILYFRPNWHLLLVQ